MTAFPKTLDELRAAGYRFYTTRKCSYPLCHTDLEFWWTPANKLIPLDIDPKGNVMPHFATCPGATHFRKKA